MIYLNLLDPELNYIYDEGSMTYTATMSFLAEVPEETDVDGNIFYTKDLAEVLEEDAIGTYNPLDWEGGATNANIPHEVIITHSGMRADGLNHSVDTYLYIANIDVKNTDVENQLRVDVTYIGRVKGTLKCEPRTQMQSVRQPHSLGLEDTTGDGTGDTKIGIGPDFEGVSRPMPVSVIQVTEVIDDIGAAPGRVDDTMEIAGTVNEANWNSPWGTAYPGEGAWIYSGIVGSSIDRRSRTAQVVHEFYAQGDRATNGQHIHRWYKYTRTQGTDGRVKLEYDTTITTAQFMPIAGTDEWWDSGSIIPTWANSLDLDPVWF